MKPAWTAAAALPGGDIAAASFNQWSEDAAGRYPAVDRALIDRLCRSYGSLVDELLFGVTTTADLGRDFGGGLTQREVDYLTQHEWAETADDILWRRTKLGLRVSPQQRAALEAYLEARHSAAGASAMPDRDGE
jgi:glycerol-3-phosphate dehydrogenase